MQLEAGPYKYLASTLLRHAPKIDANRRSSHGSRVFPRNPERSISTGRSSDKVPLNDGSTRPGFTDTRGIHQEELHKSIATQIKEHIDSLTSVIVLVNGTVPGVTLLAPTMHSLLSSPFYPTPYPARLRWCSLMSRDRSTGTPPGITSQVS